jgi:hypothetical protein
VTDPGHRPTFVNPFAFLLAITTDHPNQLQLFGRNDSGFGSQFGIDLYGR